MKNKEDMTMKKEIRTLAALLIASATFVACSSDDNIANENQQPANGKYTLTINASKSDRANTRALTLDETTNPNTLTASWATSENVFVKKGETWASGSLKPQENDADATLKGTLSGITIEATDELTLQFPRQEFTYAGQKGTLADIAANFDYATAKVTVASVNSGKITVDGTTVFASQQAIVKFTLLDKADGTMSLNATKLVVNDGTTDYTITPTSATSEIYVAIPGFSEKKTVTLTATVGEYTYTYERSGVTFTNGKYYEITVKMVKAAADNPAPTTASIEDYTAGTFGWDGDGSAATGLPTINTFAANDKISILSAKNTNTQFTTSAGGASATFSGTATDDSKFYAVYPYTDDLTLSGTTITGIKIPTSQWNSGWNSDSDFSGWDPKAPIAYATTTGSSLTFHNACAILKVTITGDGMCAIFTISASEPLAGTFSLDTSTGTLTPTSGSTTVTVGTYFYDKYFDTLGSSNKTAYIAIAPGTYTNFTLYLINDFDEDKSITKSGSVTFEAGKIYDLGSYNIEDL